jgi:molybdopterin-guanine dinucleotide biosynthesis protein A
MDVGRHKIVGVILAGGASRRMGGGDKALASLHGRPLLAHVIDRLRPQVGVLVLSANGDPARFASFGLAVVPDEGTHLAGPLAGILAGLRWAASNAPAARWIATVPADTPFVPGDLVARLVAGLPADRMIAVARSRGEIHPVAALFAVSLGSDLAQRLAATRDRSVRSWLMDNHTVPVDFPDGPDGMDPFFNVNTPEDLAAATRLAAAPPPLPLGEGFEP